ncbi:MAG: nucleotide exchange factor GrpE, partial [Pseudomonadota bacterium]
MNHGKKNEHAAKPANDETPDSGRGAKGGPGEGGPAEPLDIPLDLSNDAGAVDVGPADIEDEEDDRTPEERRIAELEAEVSKMRDQALRALAEAENTRKRAEKQAQDASRYGAAGLARDILSVADNLQRALDALPPAADSDGDLLKNLRAGVEMTAK